MRRVFFRIALALTLISLTVMLSAQVTVSGRVIGNDAPNGLSGASVSLVSENNQYDTETGENGSFTLNNVVGTAQGVDYELTITKEGYIPYSATPTVMQQNVNLGNIEMNEIAWPPRNVIAFEDVVDEQDVARVTWNSAGGEGGTEQWLHWDSGQAAVGIGANAAIEFVTAARFSAQQLLDLDVTGLSITAVRFVPREQNATYTVKVYRGGRREPLHPGQEVASQAVPNPIINQWNEVILNNPVPIEMHEEIWFGVNINTQQGFPASADMGPAVDYYSNLMLWGNTWQSLLSNNPDLDYSWNLQAFAGFGRGDRSVALNPSTDIDYESSTEPAGTNIESAKVLVQYDRDLLDGGTQSDRIRRIADRNSRPTNYRELEGYTVYRLHVDDEDDPDEWTELATIEDTVYVDTTWEDIGQGLHRFAVRANYTGEVYSRRVLSNVVYPQYFAGGVGTRNAPWEIETAEHLDNVRRFIGPEHTDKYFRQTEHINLGVAPWNSGQGWDPIGGSGAADRFYGTYDGDGYEIRNLTIDRAANYQGLFAYIHDALLTNITLTNYSVRGNTYTGALVSYIRDSAVTNSRFDGSVTCTAYGGAVSGYAFRGTVSNVYVAGEVTATNASSSVGGIIGYLSTSNITNSYVTATVTGNNTRIGGLSGYHASGTISNCYVIGIIRATGTSPGDIGGLVGASGTTLLVVDSYWNIETTGQPISANGGEGKTTAQMLQQDTYEEWDFDNIWRMGYEGEETYPYFRRFDEPSDDVYPGLTPPSNVYAGVPGDARVIVMWEPPSYGEPDSYRLFRNNTFLQNIEADQTQFEDNNVNNLTTYRYHVTAVYNGQESTPSSVALVTPVPGGYEGGIGTADDPYGVRTAAHLEYVRRNLSSHYIQLEDIDIGHINNWTPIGSSGAPFLGSYNGQGHTIANMRINNTTTDYLGLFGDVGGGIGAVIKNIHIENAEVRGRRWLGGLAGRVNQNTIIDSCYVFADVLSEFTSTLYMGSFVGDARNAIIRNSFGSGSAISTDNRNYVGGFAGYLNAVIIENCFTDAVVQGGRYVGGFAGYNFGGEINNCYARGDVESIGQAAADLGGFMGYTSGASITNSFSTGRVTAQAGADNVGGFIGRLGTTTVAASYWDVLTSGRDFSPAGTGRQTNQMTYPYDANTYVGWDFDDIWRQDTTRRFNGGYPHHYWHPIITGPNPALASNPNPQNRANNVPVTLERVSWSYQEDEFFSNPVGFRVYLHTSDNFEGVDFTWVPYIEDQANYSTAAVIPDEMDYRTTYHWKVVPTTIDPNERRGSSRRRNEADNRDEAMSYRGDAENVVVWSFTTERNPNPVVATNPNPQTGAQDVPVSLGQVRWSFNIDEDHVNPIGFRVYMNRIGDFGDDDDFVWVPYSIQQINYSSANVLPDEVQYNTTYYWKVVPTTNPPQRSSDSNRTRNSSARKSSLAVRGDAEGVPVWSFTTEERSIYPREATNPNPEHLATGVPTTLQEVSWDYVASEYHAQPVGFRVYMNTTGNFPSGAPFVWVNYSQGHQTFSSSEIVPAWIDEFTTYYWRVVPTTEYPDDRTSRGRDSSDQRSENNSRNDAQNVVTWRFTTSSTTIEDEGEQLPLVTGIKGNYPNPFNPDTSIRFELAEEGEVLLYIYNTKGQIITTLIDKYMKPGNHVVRWDGNDQYGNSVSSGIYFSVMKAGDKVSSSKMILLK